MEEELKGYVAFNGESGEVVDSDGLLKNHKVERLGVGDFVIELKDEDGRK